MSRRSFTICLLTIGLVAGRAQVTNSLPASKPAAPPENAETNALSAKALAVQDDVRVIAHAVYGGDVATVLKFTHPKIIEQMGGLTQARISLQNTMSQVLTMGMTVESLTFPSAPLFTNSPKHEFVIVPTKIILAVRDQRLESMNYQFGVREPGETHWTYIEGTKITAENVKTFFPDFPDGVPFPKVYRKRIG